MTLHRIHVCTFLTIGFAFVLGMAWELVSYSREQSRLVDSEIEATVARESLQPVAYTVQQLGKKIAAAEFPKDEEWVNIKDPLTMAELRGGFVLLDFWTYCCINCMHILPVLDEIEKKYEEQLLVVGVHTAKFATERDTENIREAIHRYEIRHPVINDTQQQLWQYYGVDTWPTLVLIDPDGDVIWANAGEITFKELDQVLRNATKVYKGKLRKRTIKIEYIPFDRPESPLRFPGKVLADGEGGRLFISDSNHNRIVVTSLDGTLDYVIGSGQIGKKDGTFEEAEFNHPQGMALAGPDQLYVADTENHLIRRVDLAERKVITVAGTGEQLLAPWQGFANSANLPKRVLKKPRTTPIASPWDLCVQNNVLWIAMAGPHQIWRMSLDEKAIGQFAGNGREDIVDGALLPRQPYGDASSFAQPSGLATDGKVLFVADSEGSSIRAVPFVEDGLVTTVVGTSSLASKRLFTFGDRDGTAAQALLQHPLGVAYLDRKVFVTDTYNNKVKWIDLATGSVRTLIGSGVSGATDQPPLLDEPSGLSVLGSKLYIADTNNHSIRVWDLEKSVLSTLKVEGLAPPGAKPPKLTNPFPKTAKRVKLERVVASREAAQLKVSVKLGLEEGWKINSESPQGYVWQWTVINKPVDDAKKQQLKKPTDQFEFTLPIPKADNARLQLALTHYYCQEADNGVCVAETVIFEITVERTDQGSSDPKVTIQHLIVPQR